MPSSAQDEDAQPVITGPSPLKPAPGAGKQPQRQLGFLECRAAQAATRASYNPTGGVGRFSQMVDRMYVGLTDTDTLFGEMLKGRGVRSAVCVAAYGFSANLLKTADCNAGSLHLCAAQAGGW